MERPLVSVLVLSRRRPDRLRACLAGIALQDHPDLETHVLANGCPETAALIRAEYPDLSLHEEAENIGCAPGRDRLVREARGEYVLFVDDDGELRSPDILRRLVDAAEADPHVAVVSMALMNAATDEPTGWRRQSGHLTFPCYHASFAGGACLVRRQVFLDVGGYGDGFHGCGEEFDLTVRLYAAGWAVLHFPEVEFHHHVDKDEGAWRAQLCRGYRHLQYTVRRLYPRPWCWLAATKSLLTHLYVDVRLEGGPGLRDEIAASRRWWTRGSHVRAPVSREALERLYFAKYYRVSDMATLRRAPSGLLWRLPWLRFMRKIRNLPKLPLPGRMARPGDDSRD